MISSLGSRAGRTLLTEGAYILSSAAIVGKKEGEGPLGREFDRVYNDTTVGQDSWERSESMLLKDTVNLCISKSGSVANDFDLVFCGDLLDQCMGSSMAVKDLNIPVLGLYGACSTMAESLVMAAVYTAGGGAENCIAAASSHFCSAERQFRFPLGYGGQRTPTSQWTVTGAGAAAVTNKKTSVTIKGVTVGKIVDMGVTDANTPTISLSGALKVSASLPFTVAVREGAKEAYAEGEKAKQTSYSSSSRITYSPSRGVYSPLRHKEIISTKISLSKAP